MNTIIKNILCCALPAFMLYSACQSKAGNKEEPEQFNHASQSAPIQVETALSRYQPFEYLVQSNGKVRPLKEQVWFADQDRVLRRLAGQNGSSFRKGEVIAEFETADISMKLQKARLALYNAEKEYQSTLLGYENLLKDRSAEEVDAIKKKLHISSGLSYAQHEIRELELEAEKSAIRAPFNGILAGVQVRQDTKPQASQEMFRLYDPSALILEISVLEGDIYLLKPGIVAIVSPVADNAQTCKAGLLRINPYVDENGMVQVTLKLQPDRGSATLFPGMNCTATLKVPLASCIVVPKDAVVMHDGRPVVFTEEQGLAKWHYVVTGRENGKEIEIKDGLKQDEKVIISNNLQLAHDAPVREIKGKQ
jgi:membrane fusion protein (multidrug efflux system)